jgi:hypothetical protein
MTISPVLTPIKTTAEVAAQPASTTTVVPSSSDWYASALRALDAMVELPAGWDGAGSMAPNARSLGVLRVMNALRGTDMPEPDIIPGAGGRVVMSWAFKGRRLEAHFVEPNEMLILRVSSNGQLQEEWTQPTTGSVLPHLAWLVTGAEWQ